MTDTHFDVIVIGAGISGLAAALELDRRGLRTLLIDKSAHVGGRVATTAHDGFLLDHGFQVLLTAYPEAKRILDYESIKLKTFPRGATILTVNGPVDLRDPRESLTSGFTALGKVIEASDLPALWRLSRVAGAPDARDSPTVAEYLREHRFSDRVRTHFLEPFLRGILLDPELEAPIERASFYMEMFAKGHAALPAEGIGQIPASMAAKLQNSQILLGQEVAAIRAGKVCLSTDVQFSSDALVMALDPHGTSKLTGKPCPGTFHGTSCHYFDVSEEELTGLLPLILNGRDDGPVNHCAIPSVVCPDYAPTGRALLGANVVGEHANASLESVRDQLATWFGPKAAAWRLIRSIAVPYALPAQAEEPAWHKFANDIEQAIGAQFEKPLAVAGDYSATASLNGAMSSGRRAAAQIAQALGRN